MPSISVSTVKAALPAVILTILVLKFAPDKLKAWIHS